MNTPSSTPAPSGYLGTLAARALGRTATLAPVTPARFEDVRSDDTMPLIESTETVEVTAPPSPPGTALPVPPLVRTDGPPLLPRVVTPPPQVTARADDRAPVSPTRATEAADEAAPRPPAVPSPVPEPAPAWVPVAADELARFVAQAGDAVVERPAETVHDAPSPADRPTQARAPESRGTDDRRRADEPAAAAPPPVVVSIGRIEIRAVEAPRPIPPPARPAAPAAPSLADYLLARDRGRR